MQPPQLPGLPAAPSPDVASIGGPDFPQAQLRELFRAREGLETTRNSVDAQLQVLTPKSAPRAQLEAQVILLDQRIATIDHMIASVQSGPPAIPMDFGSLMPPTVPERILPKDITMLSGVFILCVLMPLAVAIALRILKRGVAKVAALPSDIAERLGRMESAIEATAIEVERIGEGQRYLTRVLGDKKAEDLLERPRPVAPYRIITPH
jgi:hypothetical protein